MDTGFFYGTGTALVTPFNSDDSIDFESLTNLINFQIENKIEYLVSLGTTGETPVLNTQERYDVVDHTLKVVGGRIPVVVGIGGNETRELIHELTTFPLQSAVAILSASPYYNKPSQEGLYQHYKAVAKASPKPIILYNVPGRTGRNMEASTTLRLAAEPNIIGIKEASGDMAQCMKILRDKPEDFFVVSGDDALALPQIACGMKGVISVASNALPLQFGEMVRAALSGDFSKAKSANDSLIEAYDLMFSENNPAGVKAFLAEAGVLQNQLRLPNVTITQTLHSKIVDYIKNHK